MQKNPSPEARTVIITGAARGIGLATAHLMQEAGWHIVRVDWDEEALIESAKSFEDGLALVCDISDPEAVTDMIARTLDWSGRIDALVNNAGVADFGPIEETNFERWRKVMATNLDGVFLVTQAAIPALKKTQGSIVNIASISGLRASSLRIAYGTSKAAVIHLTQQQAAEAGDWGVRANCICPGPVRTKLAMAVHSQDIIDAYHDAIPLNRYGYEEEIAHAIHFLASDKASYITGQTLSVDGGFEAMGIGLPSLRKTRAGN